MIEDALGQEGGLVAAQVVNAVLAVVGVDLHRLGDEFGGRVEELRISARVAVVGLPVLPARVLLGKHNI